MKRNRLILAATAVLLIILALLKASDRFEFWPSTPRRQGTAFTNSSELVLAVKRLPLLNMEATAQDWKNYVFVGKRLRVTNLAVVNWSLHELCMPGQYPGTSIKVMMLLRICFECRKMVPPSEFQRGWTSDSQRQSGSTTRTLGWPIGLNFGRFYLEDTVDGYLGPGYDGSKEFQWMSTNCSWRRL